MSDAAVEAQRRRCKTLHFAPKAKRVIYLFMSGGPSHIDLFDYKPQAAGAPRHGAARLGPHGPAHHRHDVAGRSRFPASRRCSSSPSTASAARGSASCCRTLAAIVDDIAIVKSLNTEAINHDPAITYIQTGHQQPGRPSLGRLAELRPGQREREPAGVRRDDLAGQRQQDRPAALLAAVGQRLPAVAAPGRALPLRRRPGAVPLQPARHRRRQPPRACSTASAS